MIDELAARIFATRDMAHMAHWRTASYPEHVALGDFYEALPGLIDALVEAYQGQHERIEPFQVQTRKADIRDHLEDDIEWMQAMRDDITGGDPSLLNLLDGIIACYQKTLYLLSLS